MLLYEISAVYARLLGAVLAERREREARLLTGDAVAASIAHEVRQPLTAMVTSADAGLRILNRSTPDLDKAREAFKDISSDGTRAGEIIRSIRATFKNDIQNRTTLDINELIGEALALERSDLQKHQILVEAQPSKQLPEVQGDRVQLEQVLLNLITNAIHAMARKRRTPRPKSEVGERTKKGRVIVSVADTGNGIAPRDIDRIFNPFSRQKLTVWGWDCRYAVRSLRLTKAGVGCPEQSPGCSIPIYLTDQRFDDRKADPEHANG